MSLNGLDNPDIVEAYEQAVKDASRWFLLYYTSRDTVDLHASGAGGYGQLEANLIKFEQKSPLYGYVTVNGKKTLFSYLPEGTSRLLQGQARDRTRLTAVRTQVHFQNVIEQYPLNEVTPTIRSPKGLVESHSSPGDVTPRPSTAASPSMEDALSLARQSPGGSDDAGQRPGSSAQVSSILARLNLNGSLPPPPKELHPSLRDTPPNLGRSQIRPSFDEDLARTSQSIKSQIYGQDNKALGDSRTVQPAQSYHDPIGRASRTNSIRSIRPWTAESGATEGGSFKPKLRYFARSVADSPVQDKRRSKLPSGFRMRKEESQQEDGSEVGQKSTAKTSGPVPNGGLETNALGYEREQDPSPYRSNGDELVAPPLGPRSVSTASSMLERPSDLAHYEPDGPPPPLPPALVPSEPKSLTSKGSIKSFKSLRKQPVMTKERQRLMKALEIRKKQQAAASAAPARPTSILGPASVFGHVSATAESVKADSGIEVEEIRMGDTAPEADASTATEEARDSASNQKLPANATELQHNALLAIGQVKGPVDTAPGLQTKPDLAAETNSPRPEAYKEGESAGAGVADDAQDKHAANRMAPGVVLSDDEVSVASPVKDSQLFSDAFETFGSDSRLAEEDSYMTSKVEAAIMEQSALAGSKEPAGTQSSVTEQQQQIGPPNTLQPDLVAPNIFRSGHVKTLSTDTAGTADTTDTEDTAGTARPGSLQRELLERQFTQDSASTSGMEAASIHDRSITGFASSYDTSGSEVSQENSLFNELQNATLGEATRVAVPSTPRRTLAEEQQLPAQQPRSEPNTARDALYRNASVKSALRQNAEPVSPGEPLAPVTIVNVSKPGARRPNLSSGISKRIQALEEHSQRAASPTPPQASSSYDEPTTFLGGSARPAPQRALSIASRPSSRSSSRAGYAPRIFQPLDAISDTSLTSQQEKSKRMSITARIIRAQEERDTRLLPDKTTTTDTQLQRSHVIIERLEQENVPEITATPPVSLADRRMSSTGSIRPESRSSSRSIARGSSLDMGFRFIGRMRNESKASAVAEKSPTRSTLEVVDEGHASRDDYAETISEEKKSSRASRFLKRIPGFGKKVTSDATPTPQVPIDTHGVIGTASNGRQASMIGNLNVQFPEALFWKRRWVEVDNLGSLILSGEQSGEARHAPKRYHLSAFQRPHIPTNERQELPHSIVLDLLDGGTLQLASDDRRGQMEALKKLSDAHKAVVN